MHPVFLFWNLMKLRVRHSYLQDNPMLHLARQDPPGLEDEPQGAHGRELQHQHPGPQRHAHHGHDARVVQLLQDRHLEQ